MVGYVADMQRYEIRANFLAPEILCIFSQWLRE
ncbi:hypothetical protein EV561_105174 [Rhizobium sp. BK376]|nr:hypothetical protein EV561_105174 [Rhizobium sp. BK376]